jgi:hypothetical protein
MSHGKTFVIICGFLLVLSSKTLAASPPGQETTPAALENASCEEQAEMLIAQTDQANEPTSGDIQERAVPHMSPGAGAAPSTRFKGGTLEGNRLRADPGYTLHPLPGGGGVMLRPNGGGTSVEANCRCPKTGGCSVSVDGGLALCTPSTTNGCKVGCLMILGVQRSGGSMLMQ